MDPSTPHTATVTQVMHLAGRVKAQIIKDNHTLSNGPACLAASQSILDYCEEHKGRLIVLDAHGDVVKRLGALHDTLRLTEALLEEYVLAAPRVGVGVCLHLSDL